MPNHGPPLLSEPVHADLETPVSAYLKLRHQAPWSFLYESIEGPSKWARYSILGIGARRTFVAQEGKLTISNGNKSDTRPAPDPLAGIRQALSESPLEPCTDAPAFVGGIFGYVSYDAIHRFESLGTQSTKALSPDAAFFEPELLAVFDNHLHSLVLYSHDQTILNKARQTLLAPLPPYQPPQPWQPPVAVDDRASFCDAVSKAQEYIRAGDIIQVVLSRRFELPRLADPFHVYRGLRTINPSPYLYNMHTPGLDIAGASPEVMVRIEGNRMTVRPIAGTRPRTGIQQDDARLANELLSDPKERAEHIMLVDLGRNDVGKVCEPGSVSVSDLMVVEHYSHVMHIVSEVQGTLAGNQDAFDALRSSFPAGTLSGAPKIRAMQIIQELEESPRGLYGGAVGYFGPSGNADFGIAIRTLIAYPDRFAIQAGAGIVADSDPEKEADETEHKAQAVIRAAQWAASRQSAW